MAISARTPISMLANEDVCMNVWHGMNELHRHTLVLTHAHICNLYIRVTHAFGTYTWTRMSAQQEMHLRSTAS